jgi:hypothetical protein
MKGRRSNGQSRVRGLCLAVAIGPAAWAGELATNLVPAQVLGAVEYVPGKYGLAVQTQTAQGIHYPCGRATFDPAEGTFACWVKASAYHCVWAFRMENEMHLKLGMWHDKAQAGEPTKDGYVYEPFPFYGNTGLASRSLMLPDIWYHVAMTWNFRDPKARGLLWVWVNGQRGQGPVRIDPPFDQDPGKTLLVGTYPGAFDDVVFLDKALTDEEIKRLFFSGSFTPDEHTRLYVSFDGRNCDGVSIELK